MADPQIRVCICSPEMRATGRRCEGCLADADPAAVNFLAAWAGSLTYRRAAKLRVLPLPNGRFLLVLDGVDLPSEDLEGVHMAAEAVGGAALVLREPVTIEPVSDTRHGGCGAAEQKVDAPPRRDDASLAVLQAERALLDAARDLVATYSSTLLPTSIGGQALIDAVVALNAAEEADCG